MAGKDLALPFLIINLGGEMLYILNQRLEAQKVPSEKALKVRCDVVKHLFAENFVDELLREQPLFSMTSTRKVFDKLAHSSIMKLQTSSMNKLFDLMLMGVKMQMFCVKYPEEVLQVTYNHLYEIRSIVRGNGESEALVNRALRLLKSKYEGLKPGVFNRIRQSLLAFFQERNVKVSLFLNKGIQGEDGIFRIDTSLGIPNSDTPGKVVKFGQEGSVQSEYSLQLSQTQFFQPCSFSSRFENSTSLGCNLYSSEVKPQPPEEQKESLPSKFISPTITKYGKVTEWELNTLADMIGTAEPTGAESVHINLFTEDIQTFEMEEPSIQEVQGTRQLNSKVEQLMNDLNIEEESKDEENELFDLL